MDHFIKGFIAEVQSTLATLPTAEIARGLNELLATYERDGHIYVFGNGGSLSLATHWVSDFNKSVFSHRLDDGTRRFRAIRLPTTEEELSAWSNDVGYEMVFAGPLENYIQELDCVIAISSSGSSPSILRAVELARRHHVPVIGLSGFDGGKLRELADVRIHVPTAPGAYGIVEGIHAVILHLFTKYFQDYFDHEAARAQGKP
ncbi:MAG TPA: SIS domain-containing protein [Kofleriaceae bacterium]|nr:SIS domain-containing protein [Kofleriaceae bacterium]